MRRDNVQADKLPRLDEALKHNEPLLLGYCYGWEWLRLRYGSVLLEWSLFDLGWNDWGYQVDEAAHFRRMIL
jgi:hypothetical protein